MPNSAQQEERQQVQNKCNTYNSHNRECEMKPKQDGICKGTNSSCNRAILLLLISLAATIFCGKIVAILITSICLYFLPRQQHPIGVGENLGNIERSPENKSRDYKRVIMKGLLERNHNRGAFNFLTWKFSFLCVSDAKVSLCNLFDFLFFNGKRLNQVFVL